ncbi:MAG: EamA family transporter [Candidatus Paceibacterota bacterium]
MSKILILIAGILISAITVFGDFFVKKASLTNSVWNKWLFIGASIYALTAIGWAYALKFAKLSTFGVIYGVSSVMLVVALSVFVFHEKLSTLEVVGILLGIISLILLYKFS